MYKRYTLVYKSGKEIKKIIIDKNAKKNIENCLESKSTFTFWFHDGEYIIYTHKNNFIRIEES